MSKHLSVAALGLVACQSGMDLRPLDDEEQAAVDHLMEVGSYEDDFVERAMEEFGVTVFDASGDAGLTAAIADLDKTRETLETYYRDGRIYAYDESWKKYDDAGAVHVDPVTKESYIAMNARMRDDWSYSMLQHESAHALDGGRHSAEMEAVMADGENAYTDVVAQAVAEKDYAYLLSMAYVFPDNAVRSLEEELAFADFYARDYVTSQQYTAEESLAFYDATMAEVLSSRSAFGAWVYEQSEDVGREYAEAFGMEPEVVQRCMSESSLFDYGTARSQEARAELQQWLEQRENNEARREMQRKMPPEHREGRRL